MTTATILSILMLTFSQPADSLFQDQWLIDEWNESYNQKQLVDFNPAFFVHLVDWDGTVLYSIKKDDMINGVASSEEMDYFAKADYMFSDAGDDYYMVSDDVSKVPASDIYPYSSAAPARLPLGSLQQRSGLRSLLPQAQGR